MDCAELLARWSDHVVIEQAMGTLDHLNAAGVQQ